MSGDILGKRIRELRLERQSLEWDIEQSRTEDHEPPEFLFNELRKVCEELLIVQDDRSERI